MALVCRYRRGRHVLTALRTLPNDLTAEFMIDFYRAWIEQDLGNPHAALRTVQRAYARNPDPVKAAPGFWGAFVVIGPWAGRM